MRKKEKEMETDAFFCFSRASEGASRETKRN